MCNVILLGKVKSAKGRVMLPPFDKSVSCILGRGRSASLRVSLWLDQVFRFHDAPLWTPSPPVHAKTASDAPTHAYLMAFFL